ncbi:MAG: Nif3-like dinuclear metal center hexameric protein [Paludibacter sp.]|nr:Nif3-like dinuclear metal center hexameric protein [Paludibacter sp.]MDD4197880.1 Nif3-like dinuclear metal center hexameric protein [Paludibacter sp.]MDD4428130.1 Nif3-like dinuclear metal center hexameric protein [Paludibacter sp.]
MEVKTVTDIIESFAPLVLQESYDNAGLLVGNPCMQVSGVLLCIDVTEAIIEEAIAINANLIIAHHPLIFSGLKKITGQNEVQRCVIKAIKHDIAIYVAHTNIDNVADGVNGIIANKIGLENRRVLQPKQGMLVKLVTFVPKLHVQRVREAIFEAGGGNIGNYDACSFNSEGYGSFRPNSNAHPFVGEKNKIYYEEEIKIEVILPDYIKNKVITSLIKTHPYEEPAYDVFPLLNEHQQIGSGLIGELKKAEDEMNFMLKIKNIFGGNTIRHTASTGKKIKKVALCGGAGSFLLQEAIRAEADIFISGDFKYHDFFDANKKIIVADVGHFETEQFTKELFFDIIRKKLPTFAVHISKINTNPIIYL